MKRFNLTLVATFFAAIAVSAGPIVLSPERANHTATLMNTGAVLIAGGINENATLDSALLYDPNGQNPRKLKVTGTMTSVRSDHTATLLNDGKVLVAGGELSNGQLLKSSEVYDPATGVFTAISKAMTVPRSKHTATLLPDGRVLLDGGKSADLYDPVAQTYTATTGTPQNRKSHAALLLPNGTVLITGGYVGKKATVSAEIYTPATQTFTVLANTMTIPRANHAMTMMADGRVLITGGYSGTSPHDETEIYDPVAQSFTTSTTMLFHRSNHRSLLLTDGRVMVIGGTTLESGFLATNELFNPATATWSEASDEMQENRSGHTATMMPDGTIFVAGGVTGSTTQQGAEVVDPISHVFSSVGNMTEPRNQHTDTLLPDGTVLLVAGSTDAADLKSGEIFNPGTNTFSALSSQLSEARKSHTATLLQDGQRVLIAGGKTAEHDTKSAAIYDVSPQQFRDIAPMQTRRSLFTATLLNDGRVLVAAGRHGGTPTTNAELFNPTSETFARTGNLNLQRKRHRAVLLLDGTVLVSGGASLSNDDQPNSGTPTCEIFDPATGLFTWHPPADMSVGRTEHESTLLPNGTALESGGLTLPSLTDIYQPASKAFTTAASLITQRYRHVAVLLSNSAWGSLQGQVLIIGGATDGTGIFGGLTTALDSVELYNPATGTYSSFGTMVTARQNHTATLLNDGRIMIAGGVGPTFVSGTAELIRP